MNIQELAKESGASVIEDDPQCWIGCIGFDAIALERFAALVLEEAANIAERTPKMSAYDSNMAVQDYIAKKLRTEASALKGAKE